MVFNVILLVLSVVIAFLAFVRIGSVPDSLVPYVNFGTEHKMLAVSAAFALFAFYRMFG